MRRKSCGLTLVELLVVIAIVGLLVALLLPAVRSAGPAARRSQCLNNVKQLNLALLTYHDKHASFPPAYTVDEEGNKLHSWRALILPYMEEQSTYDMIDLTEPWDSPVNAQARAATPLAFQCSSIDVAEGMTTYLAVVGPNFVFSGSKATKTEDIADGTSTTLLLIDAAAEHAVHWMSPEDAGEETVLSYGEDSKMNHTGGYIGGFADGHCESISIDSSAESRRAMLTIAGNEPVVKP